MLILVHSIPTDEGNENISDSGDWCRVRLLRYSFDYRRDMGDMR